MSLDVLHKRLAGYPWSRNVKDLAEVYSIKEESGDVSPGVIGKGTFAEVKRCVAEDGQVYAVKSISKRGLMGNERRIRHVLVEVASTVLLDHSCLVKTHEVLLTKQHIHMVMWMCTGVTLHDHLNSTPDKRMNSNDSGFVLKQVLSALQCLHEHSLVHRDVKPANIVVNPVDLKTTLIDIGLGKHIGARSSFPDGQNVLFATPTVECLSPGFDTVLATPDAGTTSYLAVEGLAGKVASDQLDLDGWESDGRDLFKLDVYATGVTGFVMLTGRLPYVRAPSASLTQLKRLMKTHPASLPLVSSGAVDPNLPSSGRSLIERMLHHSPAQRPSSSEALQNAWLVETNHSEEGIPTVGTQSTPIMHPCQPSLDMSSDEASYQDVLSTLKENDNEAE